MRSDSPHGEYGYAEHGSMDNGLVSHINNVLSQNPLLSLQEDQPVPEGHLQIMTQVIVHQPALVTPQSLLSLSSEPL